MKKKRKCLCCGKEITEYNMKEFCSMNEDEINNILNEHELDCEWKEHFRNIKGKLTPDEFDGWGILDDINYLDMKIKSLFNILKEKDIVDNEIISKNLIYSIRKAIDFKWQDEMIKKINSEFPSKK